MPYLNYISKLLDLQDVSVDFDIFLKMIKISLSRYQQRRKNKSALAAVKNLLTFTITVISI